MLTSQKFAFSVRASAGRSAPVILSVGRLVEKKGFGDLLQGVPCARDNGS